MTSGTSEQECTPIAVDNALKPLLSKIIQPGLEALLQDQERYLEGLLGSKRASTKFLDMSYSKLSGPTGAIFQGGILSVYHTRQT